MNLCFGFLSMTFFSKSSLENIGSDSHLDFLFILRTALEKHSRWHSIWSLPGKFVFPFKFSVIAFPAFPDCFLIEDHCRDCNRFTSLWLRHLMRLSCWLKGFSPACKSLSTFLGRSLLRPKNVFSLSQTFIAQKINRFCSFPRNWKEKIERLNLLKLLPAGDEALSNWTNYFHLRS